MLNFLPQKNRKQIFLEYIFRISIYLSVFVTICCLFLISLFSPSYFFAKYKNETSKTQLESAKQENINKGEDPITFIKNINRLSIALSDNKGASTTYTGIINKIISLKNDDIRISSIIISKENATGTKKIQVNGIANTRDSLTSFSQNVKISGYFTTSIFPVANFLKSTNSDFSATLTI